MSQKQVFHGQDFGRRFLSPKPALIWLVIGIGIVASGCGGSRARVSPLLQEFDRFAADARVLEPSEKTLAVLGSGQDLHAQATKLEAGGKSKQAYPLAVMAVADARVALASAQVDQSERRADSCRREVERARAKWDEAIHSLEETESVVSRTAPIPRKPPELQPEVTAMPPTTIERAAPPIAPADILLRDWTEWKRVAGELQVSVADIEGSFLQHQGAAASKETKEEARPQHLHMAGRYLQEVECRVRTDLANRYCVRASTVTAQLGEATDAARAATLDLERGLQDNLRKQLEASRQESKDRQTELYGALQSLEGKYARIAQDARGTIVSLADILFDFDKATLRREVEFALVRVSTILNQFGEMKIAVEGHTDNIGKDEYNLDLSKRRAKAVYDFLVSQDVVAERMTYEGYGMTRPLADNATEQGRQQNRRVDLVIREE